MTINIGVDMKTIIINYLENFWQLLGSISPYIIIGIFLAGVMKLIIPQEWIRKQLGGKNFYTLFKAILLGIPLPLCSCSVIPFATALRKSGASKASTLGFLISTPITGADSIIATYGVLGLFFTIYRIVSSIFIAILAGILTLIFDKEKEIKEKTSKIKITKIGSLNSQNISFSPTPKRYISKDESSCKDGCCQKEKNFLQRLWYESVEKIFADFAKAMLIGIVLGALLVTLMPTQLTTLLGENLWLNYLLILLISAPLYICATSSIPLGLALLGAGFSPGAVFILLTAGPATSTITISVVLKLLGKRSLFIYLMSVIIGTLLFGWFLDSIFTSQANEISKIVQETKSLDFLENISALFILVLSWKIFFPNSSRGSCCKA